MHFAQNSMVCIPSVSFSDQGSTQELFLLPFNFCWTFPGRAERRNAYKLDVQTPMLSRKSVYMANPFRKLFKLCHFTNKENLVIYFLFQSSVLYYKDQRYCKMDYPPPPVGCKISPRIQQIKLGLLYWWLRYANQSLTSSCCHGGKGMPDNMT